MSVVKGAVASVMDINILKRRVQSVRWCFRFCGIVWSFTWRHCYCFLLLLKVLKWNEWMETDQKWFINKSKEAKKNSGCKNSHLAAIKLNWKLKIFRCTQRQVVLHFDSCRVEVGVGLGRKWANESKWQAVYLNILFCEWFRGDRHEKIQLSTKISNEHYFHNFFNKQSVGLTIGNSDEQLAKCEKVFCGNETS